MYSVSLVVFVFVLASAFSAWACPVYNERRSDDLKVDDSSDGSVKGALRYLENLDKFYSNAARPRFGKRSELAQYPILNLLAMEYQRQLSAMHHQRT